MEYHSAIKSNELLIHTSSMNLRCIFKKDFIYLFMRDREREAETSAEGEAGLLWGA